jgi:hypothetical protein
MALLLAAATAPSLVVCANTSFVFLHVPKAGGSSLTQLLIDASKQRTSPKPAHCTKLGTGINNLIHATPYDLEAFWPWLRTAFKNSLTSSESWLASWTSAAVVRNPYARCRAQPNLPFSPHQWRRTATELTHAWLPSSSQLRVLSAYDQRKMPFAEKKWGKVSSFKSYMRWIHDRLMPLDPMVCATVSHRTRPPARPSLLISAPLVPCPCFTPLPALALVP